MLKKILGWLLRPWLLAVLGIVALAMVLWIVGPLVAIAAWRPLEPVWARLLAIGLIAALYFGSKLLAVWRARRRNQRVVEQMLARDARAPDAPPPSDEVKKLEERFGQALGVLRDARFSSAGVLSSLSWRFGGRYLYELPWYVIVGAPGAGKTTALLNSGLTFPLRDALGVDEIGGVGGTRNCDWLFTDQAVLLDTAGRYTTHDSDPEGDRRAWLGFLALLKRSRPRRPLNGILLTVSVTDLLRQTAVQRRQFAESVRARVQELQQTLGLRLPVYVLVTKCDLLGGFVDYFADVDKGEREQPWGFTFAYERSTAGSALDEFGARFDELCARIFAGANDRIQQEREPGRRARIYAFGQQLGGLREALVDVLRAALGAGRLTETPLVRGVFFVSGTQEGTPIDRMLGAIGRELKLARPVLPPNRSAGRSYFLTRVLKEVVFAESHLAGVNLVWQRRRRILLYGGYALAAVVAIGLTAGGITSFVNNRAFIADTEARVAAVRQRIEATPNRAAPDLAPMLPVWSAMRGLATLDDLPSAQRFRGLGLDQRDKLVAAGAQAYRRALLDSMLPRIALRIEEQLRNGSDGNERLYEALRTYVMLFAPERFDAAAFQAYVRDDWDATLAGTLTPEQRTALERHLALLAEQERAASPLAPDRALVDRLRTQLAATPIAQRVYNRIKHSDLGADLPEFTLARAAGSGASLVFVRASGAPLTSGIPGLYTNDGYNKKFQHAVDDATRQIALEENWVLAIGEATGASRWRDPLQLQQLTDEVRRLYLNDYGRLWEAYVADVRLIRTTNLQQSVQAARLLSAPDSPLVPLVKALARETSLLGSDDSTLRERIEQKATGMLQSSRDGLSKLLDTPGTRSPNATIGRPEASVDDRFSGLRALLQGTGKGTQTPLDATLALINDAYTMLNAIDVANRSGAAPPLSDVPARLRAEAARLPAPVRAVLVDLANASATTSFDSLRKNLGAQVKANIGEFCRQAIAGRYPFVRASTRDVTPDDFARLFAPSGMFDEFFQKNLAALVDTTTRPWTFRAQGDVAVADDTNTLLQFQRAAAIRDAFFHAGTRVPGIRLDFMPVDMDTSITQFNLDVDGQAVRYAHGPPIRTAVQWPGPRGTGQVRLQLSPPVAGGDSGVAADGPWALFHLLDRMHTEVTGSPDRIRVGFNVSGRQAKFDVIAASVQNPLRMRELAEFRCPGGL